VHNARTVAPTSPTPSPSKAGAICEHTHRLHALPRHFAAAATHTIGPASLPHSTNRYSRNSNHFSVVTFICLGWDLLTTFFSSLPPLARWCIRFLYTRSDRAVAGRLPGLGPLRSFLGHIPVPSPPARLPSYHLPSTRLYALFRSSIPQAISHACRLSCIGPNNSISCVAGRGHSAHALAIHSLFLQLHHPSYAHNISRFFRFAGHRLHYLALPARRYLSFGASLPRSVT